MANKVFKQGFASDFGGIDGVMSSLEADTGDVNRAVNLEFAVGNSLRGRVGCQTAGSNGFFGIFPYSYTRTQDEYAITYENIGTLSTTKTSADGASINKLIGINQQMWTLENLVIPVTYVSGTYPFTHYATVSGSNINFVIKANGVSILNTSMGDGVSSLVTIYDLLGTIDALAQVSVNRNSRGTCPPFAIANSTVSAFVGSATYGSVYSVTVAAAPAHNFIPGDIITFPNTATGSYPTRLVGGFVIAITATVITYVGIPVVYPTGTVFGYMGQSAASFNIAPAVTTSSGNLSLSFPYWRLIPEGDYIFGNIYDDQYYLSLTKTSSSFFAPPTSTNLNGCLYLAGSSAPEANLVSNYLSKTDGLTITRVGIYEPPSLTLTTPAAAGALPAGTYKYKFFMRRYDAQGNIIDGVPSSTKTITVAAPNQYVSILLGLNGWAAQQGFEQRSAYKAGVAAPANPNTTFIVDDGAAGIAFLQPGDPILLLDDAATAGLSLNAYGTNLGVLHKTVCTYYDGTVTPGGIRVADSSGYTIKNNTPISTGITAVILRTAVGGNTFYQLTEIPIASLQTSQVITDEVLDVVLTAGLQYEEVPIGKEHNPPPKCSLVCSHQGGLVVARGVDFPNTVTFSTIDGAEYFPTASNSLDVPSTNSGKITAIASDTADRLAVFKERSYFDVAGDLDGGTFSVNVISEGDYGITSHASLKRVKESLIGLSRNGYISVHDGSFSPVFVGLNARLINQNYQFGWATAQNDYFNRNYICSIPVSGGEPITHIIDYSRIDPESLRTIFHTFERSYTTKIDPVGGQVMIDDSMYHLSQTFPYGVFRRLVRFNGDSPGSGNGDSFIDNTNAISYILESNAINFGEPAQLKTPIRVRLWSLPNDYVVEGWVTFSTLIETGATALATYIAGTGGTSSTVTFSTANDAFKDVKLNNVKTHFYLIRMTTNTIRTAPFWTGYEIMFADNYPKEDFSK